MLRPTLAEILAGLQRTVIGTLLPELSSPYAQNQAAMAAASLGQAALMIEKAPPYDHAETADLRATLTALKHGCGSAAQVIQRTIAAGALAAERSDQRAMESAVAELASALALGQLDNAAAETLRGYLRRYLERTRALLQTNWGA